MSGYDKSGKWNCYRVAGQPRGCPALSEPGVKLFVIQHQSEVPPKRCNNPCTALKSYYQPEHWFAPPGSNQSSSGGNEIAEASGVESR